ncbi:MAG: hypothetical protein KC461_06925 [Dehalococcoidia bacterium]|nr:hypothetical protein [Dehalococcoidia bacterium]MCA9857274.1 hypothetical protein [Dehalococcoidia bacterium]
MVKQRYRWCVRRVTRTWWLLRQDETRADIATYLVTQGAAYAREIGREAQREFTAGRAGHISGR